MVTPRPAGCLMGEGALRTKSDKWESRLHNEIRLIATKRVGTNLGRHALPSVVMTVLRTDKGVRYFVENGVADTKFVIHTG